MPQDAHAARKEIIAHCDADIAALVAEAGEAGIPLEKVVIVVADDRDPTGRKVAEACSRLGQPLTGAHVYVVGLPFDVATDVLASVDVDLATRLDPSPPAGTAQVICLAEGGISSLWLGARPG